MQIVSKVRNNRFSRRSVKVEHRFPERATDLSRGARLYRETLRMLQETPEVRPQRVTAVRRRLQSGQYEIDSKHLVELILESAQDMRDHYRAAA